MPLAPKALPMKKSLLLLTIGCASVSNAALNFNLDALDPVVIAQGSSYTFTGTIQLSAGWDVTGATLEHPGNGVTFLTPVFAPSFLNYVLLNTSAPYSGDLFTISTTNATAPGLYDLNNSSFGMTDLSEMIVTASKAGRRDAKDNEIYAVEVEAVPEPATMAALGLGVAAAVRRRRASK